MHRQITLVNLIQITIGDAIEVNTTQQQRNLVARMRGWLGWKDRKVQDEADVGLSIMLGAANDEHSVLQQEKTKRQAPTTVFKELVPYWR